MKEKILVLAITIISVLSALVSCSQVPNEELPIETTVTPETTEAIPDDPVINSFYADYVNFSFHPEDDYAYLIAANGTEEHEKWKRIYVDPEKNKDILIFYQEGEVYEVFYFGEITTTDDGYGYVEQLHSFRIMTSPREYSGIGYSVSVLRESYNSDAIRPLSLAARGKSEYPLLLLAQTFDEFAPMIGSCFMVKMEIPENPTYIQKKTLTFYNQRQQLLDVYDAAFFNSHDLLMIFISSGSGSERYDVEDISVEEALCNVTVRITEPSGTCDMENWIIYISIPKEVSAAINEYKYEVLPYEWEKRN